MSTDQFLIGITGPIGCGKSTVARMLGDLGGAVIDADVLARKATEPGAPALHGIQARFGQGVFAPDGLLDRAALAAVVFEDEAALRDLEAIVHPEVRKLVEQELASAAKEAPFAVIEAIKLVEGDLAARCQEVWIVDCSPAIQRARLVGRGADAGDIDRRMAVQGADLADRLTALVGPEQRVRRLTTNGTLDDTRTTVEDALADALAPVLLDLD